MILYILKYFFSMLFFTDNVVGLYKFLSSFTTCLSRNSTNNRTHSRPIEWRLCPIFAHRCVFATKFQHLLSERLMSLGIMGCISGALRETDVSRHNGVYCQIHLLGVLSTKLSFHCIF